MKKDIHHQSPERYFWRITFHHLKSWKRGLFFPRLYNIVNLSSGETDRPTLPANHFSAYPEKTEYRAMKDEQKLDL